METEDIACEINDDSEPPKDCEIAFCSDDATHLVVLESAGTDRQERYCGSHVTLAADDVRADPVRELVYGPAELE